MYAMFAGLRTVSDPDTGWQLATGRWIIQHHQIPRTDILSFTAAGQEWVYPILSQLSLYFLYQLGGYSLLSWFSAIACVATVAFLVRDNTVAAGLALIAVPIIAVRTAPRAELFTTVLFAVFVSTLWRYHRTGRGPLWVLPILMFGWVNLHLGFISGLGMCAGYVLLEVGELMFSERRAVALTRLRAAAPWLAATLFATLLNPWGFWNYVGMLRLVPVQSNRWIVELMGIPFVPSRIVQGFAIRDPRSGFWWLILVAVVATTTALLQRRFASAAILAASIYLAMHALRFQGPFATVVVVLGGAILADAAASTQLRSFFAGSRYKKFHVRWDAMALASVVALTALVGVRVWDLVTNRYYLRTPLQLSLFGPGRSHWYPEAAAAFVEREHVPGNLFNDYAAGGFLSWRLSPGYPDYIDGRGGPFGPSSLFRSFELLGESLDSPRWQQEASSRNINAAMVLLDFELSQVNVAQFCQSQSWRPVFIDTQAAIFVRRTPETENLIERTHLDCATTRFDEQPKPTTIRGRGEQFFYYRNAASILMAMGRNQEALSKLDLAERISPDNASLHYLKGIARFRYNRDDAYVERELRKSLDLEFSDTTSLALARLYEDQERYAQAAQVLKRAAEWSQQGYPLYLELGFVQSAMGDHKAALASFSRSEKDSPFNQYSESLGAEYYAQLAEGRARAWRNLGDLGQATKYQEKSLEFAPKDSRRWLALADLYESRGLQVEALRAREHAATSKE